MSTDEARPKARASAGRKRSEETRQAILDASLTLVREHGYASLTTDAIAAKAGAGKQTIYRWWGSKAEVVLEALGSHARSTIALPQTGALESDLAAFLDATFRLLRGPQSSRAILKALMAEAQLDEAFAERFAVFIATRRDALRSVIVRHVDAPARTIDALVDMTFGAQWYRVLVGHAPVDAAFARELATRIAAASRA